MSQRKLTFGQTLREARIARGHTLRGFAAAVGVSPTYLSQVEQDNVDPPTAERVRTMADLLGATPDEWIALAGRLPEDLPDIIRKQPTAMPELLRAASGLTPRQLAELVDRARALRDERRGGGKA